MQIELTNATMVYPKGVFVQWDMTPTAGVTGPFIFVVERSGSPEGPWDEVSSKLIDETGFYDDYLKPDAVDEANVAALGRVVYYRVKVTDPRNATAVSKPMDLDGNVAGDADQLSIESGVQMKGRIIRLRRKIIRDQTIMMRALNGMHVSVLKRRHFGTRCNICFDPLTKTVTKSKCTSCYGTGWKGGYFTPIETWGYFSTGNVQSPLTVEGQSVINTSTLTMLFYPEADDGDIIVELSTNRRWLVRQSGGTELRRIDVHQKLLVTELPRTAPEYALSATK